VVERPASVVRELIDNAIDAGATAITVELRGGGLELIRVTDDGSGIRADEVETAFLHHATSKLARFDDLLELRTLGFRGEALPSIAAVAEVELLSRETSEATGTAIVVRAGQVARRQVAARQPGTTVSVRHLFRNVPARLKFLPGGRGEAALVGLLVRRYALAHPDVRFSLAVDGHPSFRSGGAGRLELAMAEVYGPDAGKALLSIPATGLDQSAFRGWISSRAATRGSREHLTVIINGRWVVARGLLAALESAYRPFLPRGRHPIAAIVLDVPPCELDLNVHPAKLEVRLLRESEIADALSAAVRETLGSAPVRPADDADFTLDGSQYHLPLAYRRLREGGPSWLGTADEPLRAALTRAHIHGQIQDSLILAEDARGLFLIDQHRAHERYIYESLLRESVAREAQALLEPVVVELKPRQAILLERRRTELESLGIACERIGGHDFLVRSVPVLPGREDLVAQLPSLLDEAAVEDEGWRDRLVISLACRAAVRRNRALGPAELAELVVNLATTSAPAVCPHGSPLILHLSKGFLQKQFDW
jgi:DNA mismatch repair protein MutL